MGGDRFVIAVVDDDYRVLESLEELLASGGHTVRLYLSAEAFLEAHGVQEVDCLISDIGMPGMSGVELLQIAQRERPALPVIFITGRYEGETPSFGLHRGVRFLFRKPFDGGEMLAAVDTCCGRAEDETPPSFRPDGGS